MIATRISVFVSPTSEPGATGPELDTPLALPVLELLGGELPDGEPLDDEQAASRAITTSTLAATPGIRYRRGRPADGRPPIRSTAPCIRELDSFFHFTMLRPYN